MTFALMCQPMVNLHSLKGCPLVSRCPMFHVGFPEGSKRGISMAVVASNYLNHTTPRSRISEYLTIKALTLRVKG
ncbi:MAG: hypothetical protein V7K25_08985 [Nostoc sp.]|uniref:hypothetical protein n=1 Tax=Nostoc sp. TaxID=1180 RepID=UPI002FF78EDE